MNIGIEEWMNRGMEEKRNGSLEEWMYRGMDVWRAGRLEVWKNGGIEEKRPAFSLIELLISLIAISVILAAFVPVVTKKLSSSASINAQAQATACGVDSCKDCNINVCNECKEGYYLVNNRCREIMPPSDQVTFQGLKIMKKNAGDDPFITDEVIKGLPIYIINTGTQKAQNLTTTISDLTKINCSSSPCCWIAGSSTTAGECGKIASSDYSGCSRTVCNYLAADYICSMLPGEWRLPSKEELAPFRMNISQPSALWSALYDSHTIDHCSSISSIADSSKDSA
ncbi:MAG: prepilin-type N-terminal cleavage/methylation domain-containing protein, partial [Methanobrevibacter sp.]|nr:prepilin-type N-terminal cleavage/methylation domain-containing protein [Methanobrevibacter sp.]